LTNRDRQYTGETDLLLLNVVLEPESKSGYFAWEKSRCSISQQADLADKGLLGTLTLATELKRGNHLLTQWGHEISPFLS
jgi:hypothetical protein